jgi:hypothetical protein
VHPVDLVEDRDRITSVAFSYHGRAAGVNRAPEKACDGSTGRLR